MDLFQLTRALVDIESTTNDEAGVGDFLYEYLTPLTEKFGGSVERQEVEARRANVFAYWGEPRITLSTHMDTVPPFLASSENAEFIFGRGACDAKGIIAAMIESAGVLLASGTRNFGLLFVVGEEKNGAGALVAARSPRASRFIICGEPTENKMAVGSKGTLRYEITASGRMAHSAYPHLGESAIEKLLDVLQDIRQIELPTDPLLGTSTLNIGTIEGGRAPNVIPDRARAEILVRLVGDSAPIRAAVLRAVAGRAEAREAVCVPPVMLATLPGFAETVAAFTTDIPSFDGSWGTPFLIGPGSIHVAHTFDERVPKTQLREAVEIYIRMMKILQARCEN